MHVRPIYHQKPTFCPKTSLHTFTDAPARWPCKTPARHEIGHRRHRRVDICIHSLSTEIVGTLPPVFLSATGRLPRRDDLERHRMLTEILDELKEATPKKPHGRNTRWVQVTFWVLFRTLPQAQGCDRFGFPDTLRRVWALWI